MGKAVGQILGGLMLLDGLNSAIQPRFGFRLWNQRLRQYFPRSWDRLTREYERLSDPAIRYIALWEVAMAGVLLWLASKARD